ncbi:dihydropteroate synthase [Candidatus Omnitrophota bacterium]
MRIKKSRNQIRKLLPKQMIPRVISFNNQAGMVRQLRDIKVDEYGIKIMSPKANSFLIKINSVPSICANILKQEMLSLGGDVAISRQSITGKEKNTPCLIIGNNVQLKRLIGKLRMQPFRLDEVGRQLDRVIANYKKDRFHLKCGKYSLNIKDKTLIMGIINVTEDSFSGDGIFSKSESNRCLEKIVLQKAEQMIKEGAAILDIGAESSRPGSRPIDKKNEAKRLAVCLKALVKEFKVPISVDTYKPEVAKVVLDLGASIINDISGLRSIKMRKLLSRHSAGVVIMHMKGTPRTMQKNPRYDSLIDEIVSFLSSAINSAADFGISSDRIIVDPGIGFGKTLGHNLEILRNLKEFKVLGMPILLGVSRKSFLGKILGVEPQQRVFGTAAAVAMSIRDGANILRVHDVKQIKQTISVCNAIIGNN